jgi:hypothetical protein
MRQSVTSRNMSSCRTIRSRFSLADEVKPANKRQKGSRDEANHDLYIGTTHAPISAKFLPIHHGNF